MASKSKYWTVRPRAKSKPKVSPIYKTICKLSTKKFKPDKPSLCRRTVNLARFPGVTDDVRAPKVSVNFNKCSLRIRRCRSIPNDNHRRCRKHVLRYRERRILLPNGHRERSSHDRRWRYVFLYAFLPAAGFENTLNRYSVYREQRCGIGRQRDCHR